MEQHMSSTDTPTQITSHLLAALNLPPLRDVNAYHDTDRPLPLEPSAAQDAYAGRRPMSAAHQDGQQSQHEDSRQNGGNIDDVPAPVTPAYPPIIAPPQASDPALGHPPAVQPQPQPQPQTSQPQPQSQTQQPLPPQTPDTAATRRARPAAKTTSTARRARRKWTEQETNDLIMGCREHGVGNWKKVLDDPRFNFNGRSSVDLKDRFRTCFPKEYRKEAMLDDDEEASGDGTPTRDRPKRRVTKTEIHHAEVLEKLGLEGRFPKVQRRERREFTAAEDIRLLQGFTIYGASWSRIQNDPALHLNHRRSTDLRDRFRNAFPDKYESAGFKARPRHPKPRPSPEAESAHENDADGEDEVDHMPQVDPAMQETTKADSTAFIVQSLLNEHLAANWVDPGTEVSAPSDQAPAPGSLALDPALNAGFEGSALEQLTSDLLAASHGKESQRTGDVVRWEDMATHPIFEVETSFTMSTGANGKPAVTLKSNASPKLTVAGTPRKRELPESGSIPDEKRQRIEVQTA